MLLSLLCLNLSLCRAPEGTEPLSSSGNDGSEYQSVKHLI